MHHYKSFILFLVCMLKACYISPTYAQTVSEADGKDMNVLTYVIFAEDAGKEAVEVDSLFFVKSLPIIFSVGRSDIDPNNRELQHFIRYAVPLLNGQNINNARIRIRSAASPEGSMESNKRLSQGRREALLKVFQDYGVTTSQLQIDVVDEEYELLAFLMRQANDKDAAAVTALVNRYKDNLAALKSALMRYDNGMLWPRIKQQYFPTLRASRFMIVFPDNHADEVRNLGVQDVKGGEGDWASRIVFPDTLPYIQPMPVKPVRQDSVKREWLALKTNLLQDVAYVPQYGFAPIWNIQLEYYPKHGHWTVGASLDIPWWQNRQDVHKFFQIRNWQLEVRRYLFQESGSFRGWYVQAYANAAKYGIGFSETKGWQGEGWGAGLGTGYVWKLGKKRDAVRLPDGHLWTDRHHWRLELGLQVGYFRTKYDPYVWGDPVTSLIDGLYYYNWKGQAKDFRERQYIFNWLGPTRVGITLSYDIFYRKMKKKGDAR